MDAQNAILSRYACRSYQTKQITKAELEALIAAANAAPVAMGDYSGVELVIVQDEELRQTIDHETAHAMPYMGDHPTYQAPTLMFICVKPNPQFEMIPYCGASCIAENIMIQASALGLGSVYIMAVPTVMQGKPELLKLLRMSEGFMPVVLVSVGSPAGENTLEKPKRLKVNII